MAPLREAQSKAASEKARQEAAEAALIATSLPIAPPAPKTFSTASPHDWDGPQGRGSSDAKAFIYEHESGNDPTRWNSSGCVGLGQACPASKLLTVCPDLNDYACQDGWFTNYMLDRYKTWEAARAHWLARVPINGKDVGNWW